MHHSLINENVNQWVSLSRRSSSRIQVFLFILKDYPLFTATLRRLVLLLFLLLKRLEDVVEANLVLREQRLQLLGEILQSRTLGVDCVGLRICNIDIGMFPLGVRIRSDNLRLWGVGQDLELRYRPRVRVTPFLLGSLVDSRRQRATPAWLLAAGIATDNRPIGTQDRYNGSHSPRY